MEVRWIFKKIKKIVDGKEKIEIMPIISPEEIYEKYTDETTNTKDNIHKRYTKKNLEKIRKVIKKFEFTEEDPSRIDHFLIRDMLKIMNLNSKANINKDFVEIVNKFFPTLDELQQRNLRTYIINNDLTHKIKLPE